ncbi:hypothetical protein Tco_1367550 [Tanacetum coccineum]
MADNRDYAQLLQAPRGVRGANYTFYNALNANDQYSLNSAAGGNFLDKMPRECLRIIENVAALTTEVSELKNMMKTMLVEKQRAQAPEPLKAVEQSCVTCGGAHSYRNCPATNGQVYQPPTSQPPVYQAQPYQAPAQQMQGVSKTDFENYVKANDAVLRNSKIRDQSLQNQIANLTDMLSKFVNANTASSSEYSQDVPLDLICDLESGNPTSYYDLMYSTSSSNFNSIRGTGDILLLEAILNSDPSPPPPNQGNYFPEILKDLKICEANNEKSSVNEPPEVELKT